jgi:hypothetical protein
MVANSYRTPDLPDVNSLKNQCNVSSHLYVVKQMLDKNGGKSRMTIHRYIQHRAQGTERKQRKQKKNKTNKQTKPNTEN